MINKYRVHEVAKDFDVKSNIVVDLLAKYFDGQKKHMTALEEDELDIIFETFTKEHEVSDLNEYFNFAPEKKRAEKAEKKTEKAPEAAPEKAPEVKADAPENKAEPKEAPAKDKKPAQPEKQKNEQKWKRNSVL